tara:strand:- start:3144 stop:3746 length:603 start_codon:yes stop_codon:yes gene_type:complete
MTNTFLISEAQIRNYTDIEDNIDTALIKNGIREAQDIRLQTVIGTLLYNKIIALVDAEEMDLPANSNYKTLLDSYIQNMLIYSSFFYILESIYVRSRNNGLIIPDGGESSVSAERDIFNVKRQSVENKMEFYNDLLTDYIIEENTLFPELNASNKLYDLQPNYDTKVSTPFVFNRRSRLTQEFIDRGYRVYDTRYKQYPQ